MIRANQLLKQCRPGSWEQIHATCVQAHELRSLWAYNAAVQMGPSQQLAAFPSRREACSSSSSSFCYDYSRHSHLPCHRSSSSSSSDHNFAAGLQQHHTRLLLQRAHTWREPWLSNRQQLAVGSLRHTSSGSGRAIKAQEQMMKQMAQLEFDSPTLGSLCDPYRRPVSLLQSGILYNPVRLAPWIYHRFRYWLQGYMAELQAKTSIPDFHKKLMAEEVARLYRKISQAQADYRLDEVKDLVDQKLYTRMRAQAEEMRLRRWDEILFELVEDSTPLSIKLVHARAVGSRKESPITWIQLTYRIRSQQRFAAYKVEMDKQTKQQQLVHGNPDEVLAVEDHWVFEYKARTPLKKNFIQTVQREWPGARWRLVGRLTV